MSTRKSVFEIIETDEKFSILLELLNKTGLGKAIRHEENPFTFFAPTDGAFYKMFQQMPSLAAPESEKILIAPILGAHLVPGVRLYTDDLRRQKSFLALEGNTLRIRQDNHRLFVNDAEILTAGKEALNGVVFAIDKVLFVKRWENATGAT